MRADGKVNTFKLANGIWTGSADVNDRLIDISNADAPLDQWQYITQDGTVETYASQGAVLVSETNLAGLSHAFSFTKIGDQYRRTITDQFGHQMVIDYDEQQRPSKLTDPVGLTHIYAYDAANNLKSITYPDNTVKTFLFEDTRFPHAITGMIDENGKRFITYKYDQLGRAFDEYLAGNVEHESIVFSTDGISSTHTDALGTQRVLSFSNALGVHKLVARTQAGTAGLAPATENIVRDGNGNIISHKDFNGNTTTYTYDLARNLETSRIEGAGTPQARTVSTSWHTSLRVPLKIAEPMRVTTFSYDASGNVLSKSIQASTDATGAAGLAAPASGPIKTWAYTYNNAGQVLTAKGPRTDLADVTTYTYDSQGYLASVSNAAGQQTTLSNYDAAGRVGTITDPNGLVTTQRYTPRGRLDSRSVGDETWTYSYDNAGQLTHVSQPDGSAISYNYDDAHRLIGISDSVGNSITYTLDAIGNHLSEQVRDPSGALARQTARVFNALNRLQQVTGAQQ